jgi:hypothetical protein
MSQKTEKILNWYQKEIEKDKIETDRKKVEFANKLKKLKKEEIFENKFKKLTLWQRIKKVLMGI